MISFLLSRWWDIRYYRYRRRVAAASARNLAAYDSGDAAEIERTDFELARIVDRR